MSELLDFIFSPLELKRLRLPSRLIRSATYEGLADSGGRPQAQLANLYRRLCAETPLTIISGFCAVSQQGRAMHPFQGMIGEDGHIAAWKRVVGASRANAETRLIMQLAHTGRQTLSRATGRPVVGASGRACSYFRQKTRPLLSSEIYEIADDFASAAFRAGEAGFDGVQIHAAHGYLIHQFLSERTNNRQDRWSEPGLFLKEVVLAVRRRCGPQFPILLKVSYSDDYGLETETLIKALLPLEAELEAVEVSYGTMEHALNIIRGACPIDEILRLNPMFNKIPRPLKSLWKTLIFPFKDRAHRPYRPLYNLPGAAALKERLQIPVIPVGGIQSLADMDECRRQGFEALALCRPFIAEPDLAAALRAGRWRSSLCRRCNLCTVNCDNAVSLRCYSKGGSNE